MASNTNITSERSSYKAAFALDVLTAGVALALPALATRPTFRRLKACRFSIPGDDRDIITPLKTSLGTYLFLYPALLLFFIAYTLDLVVDLLKSDGTIQYDQGLQIRGSRSFIDELWARIQHCYHIPGLNFAVYLLHGPDQRRRMDTLERHTGKRQRQAGTLHEL